LHWKFLLFLWFTDEKLSLAAPLPTSVCAINSELCDNCQVLKFFVALKAYVSFISFIVFKKVVIYNVSIKIIDNLGIYDTILSMEEVLLVKKGSNSPI
jgi:hypothetical protein